jgi:hypothetical protein
LSTHAHARATTDTFLGKTYFFFLPFQLPSFLIFLF